MTTLDELLVNIGINTDELTSGADQAANRVESSLGGIQAAAAGAAVGGLFMVGLTNAMDAKHANARLTNQLGLTQEEAARAGDVAGQVFSQGFGASIDEVNESLGGVAQAMGGVGEMTNDELAEMTKNALMLADTFQLDVGESATAAGQMIANGLVKDGQEAFDVMTRAAQTLPKAMVADIPATMNEYGKHFARMGLDAQTAFGMMSQYVKAGGRDIDQAADVIHEFARITSEETDRAAEGFKALGLPAKQMLEDIGKGGKPAEEALQKTLAALRGIKDPAKQAELGVQLFGDMAGEGADALWAMDPASAAAASGMDKAGGAAKTATDNMAASQSLDAIWRTLATTLGETLAPALATISKFMSEHPGLISVVVPVILGLAAAIGIAVIAQWAWNTALFMWPGTWIILGIIALIAVIVLIIVYWDEIAAATKRVWDQIVAKLSAAWEWIKSAVGQVWDWVKSKTSTAWTWITGKVAAGVDTVMGWIDTLKQIPGKVSAWFGQVVSYVAGLPGRIGRAASGMWDGIKTAFRSAVNWLIGKWNNFSISLGGGSIMGVDIPSITLNTPNIPYLAEGGITTGPTLAMIGEGSEDEAVLPLSKLDGMLRGVAGAVRRTGDQSRESVVRFVVDGTEGPFKTWISEVVRTEGGGDVQYTFGQA
ncbi:phage tail tape measure protein [Streptomyces sp. NPDC058992]|uniref:phage tail tape measure protein n=1 Tax=Streptomyces sp. NPDC058992 TaxID=3346688 RepID=UPI0036BD2053